MERRSIVRSISDGAIQILEQYSSQELITDAMVDEIRQRLNNMVDRSFHHGDIVGWINSLVDVTSNDITATMRYTINIGDDRQQYCSYVSRMSEATRYDMKEKFNALTVNMGHITAFDRAMAGVEQ